MNLKDKVFLITGGASGLGYACARRFVAQGARVVILDYNDETGQKAARELGPQARFARSNVASEADVQKAVDLAITEFGSLHGAVCCAGIGTAEKVLNKEGKPHALASFSKTIEINLIGTFNVIRLAAAAWLRANPIPAASEAYLSRLPRSRHSKANGGRAHTPRPRAASSP